MDLRTWILNYIKSHPGVKATQLVVDAVAFCAEKNLTIDPEMPDLLEEMVRDGEIREEEYTEPSMSYRIKSRYFPV